MTEKLEISPRDYHQRLQLNRSNILDENSWLSKSKLWELKKTSLNRWRYAPSIFTGSAAADWGTVIDCLITTPEEIDTVIAIHDYPDFRTKEAREFKADAAASGKVLMTKAQYEAAVGAANKLHEDKEAGSIIRGSKKQVVLLNKLLGVNFKGLVDLAPENAPYLADLKTTGNFSIREISKTIDNFGYHVQAALYLKLWNLCFPDDKRNRFRFIWQQSTAPYEVAVTELPGFDISVGEDWAATQIERLKKATETGYWPGITEGKCILLGRPAYAAIQDEEELDGLISAPSERGELA